MIPIVKKQNQNQTIQLGDDLKIETELKTSNEQINYDDILNDINKFSNSKSTKNINKKLKMAKKIDKFNNKMNVILTKINTMFESTDKIQEIFKFVLQSCEDYLYFSTLTKEQMDELKYNICNKLLINFINDDNIRKEFIKITMKHIKPSTIFRRNKKSIQRTFFFVSKILLKAI